MRQRADWYERVRFTDLQEGLFGSLSRAQTFAEENFASRLKGALDDLLCFPHSVFSLDVFDTLLVRDNSSELRRFYEIAGRMAEAAVRNGWPISQIDALVARHLGTKASYRASRRVMGAREGALDEIHITAARLLRLPDAMAQIFVDAEVEYEVKRVTVNPLLHDLAERFKERGHRIILLSDMYFRSSDISTLLRQLDLDTSLFAAVYSSGDEKISKASGLIFAKIEQDLGSDSFVHVGDAFYGDYFQPRRHGWAAVHLPISDDDLRQRQVCHDRTANHLNQQYGIVLDVKRP